MSIFGISTTSTHNPFAVNNTASNPTMSIFGNTNNSTHNPFAVNTTVNSPVPVFGNTNNPTHNPFAVNTISSTSNSAFGNTFASNPTGNTPSSAFGNTNNSTHNPFGGSNTPSSVFGNTNNNSTHNPFGGTTTNSAFGNTNNNSTHNPISGFGNPLGVNTTGNASMPTFGSANNNSTHNPFGIPPVSSFGNTNNSTRNPFGVNTVGNANSPISFTATSTGVFGSGTSSFTNSPSIFAAPTGGFGSPTVAGFGSQASNSSFGFGPFGSAPASTSLLTGSHFGQSSNTRFGTTAPSTSNPGSFTSAFPGTNSSFPGFGSSTPSLQSTVGNNSAFTFGVIKAQNTGTRISRYAPTKDGNDRILSISSMSDYESKSHEELRWEDYELKSADQHNPTPGIGSIFNKPPASPSPFPSSGSATSNSTTPLFPQFTSSFPSSSSATTSSTTSLFPQFSSSFPSSSSATTNSTTPMFSQFPSSFPSSLQNPAPSPNFTPPSSTSLAPTWSNPLLNSTPSTTITPVFTQPSSFLQNSTPSSITTPSSIQPSPFQNLFAVNPAPPASSIPSTNTTFPSTPAPAFPTAAPGAQPPSTSWTTLCGSGQPSHPQQFASTYKVAECIVAVKDPFGSQTATSQPLIGHSICSPVIQNGISSMPVIQKPATTRISSLVSARHVSQRPLIVHSRKYHPKTDVPKVPFFDDPSERQDLRKDFTPFVPRTNPRAMFGDTTSKLSKDELHQDGGDKAKMDQASSSTPRFQVKPALPKLERSDYYTQPSLQEIRSAVNSEPGFCSRVKDFVVGRNGYGWVKFEGETDVRGLDLDALVHFNKLEVVVYMDENEKPAVGEGLNKPAEVTFLNVKCTDKTGKQYNSGKMVDKFTDKLKKVTEDQGAQFVSYDTVNGVWKFHVKHFSRYGVTHEDAE